MFTLWCCSWSVMLTMTLLFFLFPNNAVGHLSAALKTGSVTLTKFALGDNVIYCTFTNLGDSRPPILSHVRVSREPQRMVLSKDGFEMSDPFQANPMKSPSYQHKILQFHNNGQTSSGFDYAPMKLITSHHHPSTKSLPIYPVTSKFGKVGHTRQFIGSTSTGNLDSFDDDASNNDNDSWERYSSRWEPNLLPKSDEPTFTPFIGARALNIPQFFQHLRENIQAIREKSLGESVSNTEMSEVGAPSLLSTSSLSASMDGKEDTDKSSETGDIKIATPTRRGYSSNSETSIAQVPSKAGYGYDMPNRDSRSSDLYTLGGSQVPNVNANEVDPKTHELLHFLGHGKQEYPKANNYNPAWLFTNLGLGKRSRTGGGDSFYVQ